MGREGSRDTGQVIVSKGFIGPMEMKVFLGVRIIEGMSWRDGRRESESELFLEVEISEGMGLLIKSKFTTQFWEWVAETG